MQAEQQFTLFDLGCRALYYLDELTFKQRLDYTEFVNIKKDTERLQKIKQAEYDKLYAVLNPQTKKLNEKRQQNYDLQAQIQSLETKLEKCENDIKELDLRQNQAMVNNIKLISDIDNARKELSKGDEIQNLMKQKLDSQKKTFAPQMNDLIQQRKETEEQTSNFHKRIQSAHTNTLKNREQLCQLQRLVEPQQIDKLFETGELKSKIPEPYAQLVAYKQMDPIISLNKQKKDQILELNNALYNKQSNCITAVYNKNELHIIDCQNLKPEIVGKIESDESINSVAANLEAKIVVASCLSAKRIKVWTPRDNFASFINIPTPKVVTNVQFFNSEQFLTIDDTESVLFWNVNKLESTQKYQFNNGKYFQFREKVTIMCPDKEQIFCATDKGTIFMIDPRVKKTQTYLSNPANSKVLGIDVCEGYKLKIGFENREIWEFQKTNWTEIDNSRISLRSFEPTIGKYQFACGNDLTFVGTDRGNLFCFETISEVLLLNELQRVSDRSFFVGYNDELNTLYALTAEGDLKTYAAISCQE